MGKDLVNWEEQLLEDANEVAESAQGSGGGSFFSLQGGVISYGGNPVPGNALKVVVLASIYGTQYYSKDYAPGAAEAPDCVAFSNVYEDVARLGAVPEDNVISKQAEACIDCPHFKWGSGKFGRGKACKMFVRLALVPAEALSSPDEVEVAEIAMMKIPTTSVANYNEYVKALAENLGRPPWSVVTLLTAVPDKKTQFKVHFKPVVKLPKEAVMSLKDKRERYLKTDSLTFVGTAQDAEDSGKVT